MVGLRPASEVAVQSVVADERIFEAPGTNVRLFSGGKLSL